MSSRRRWLLLALAGVVGVGLLLARPEGVPVQVGAVARTPLEVTVEDQGQTRVRHRYTVAAPITGRLLRTDVDEGWQVAADQTLAMMAPPPEDPRTEATNRAELDAAEARAREAGAALTEAESADAQARREARRRVELSAQGTVSAETLERYEQAARTARARLDTARASLRAAQADVERARARLLGSASDGAARLAEVRAPVAGTVLLVHEESERVVPAGTPLFELGDGRGLEIVVDLLTEEAVRVEAGAVVRITGWGGPHALEGRVRRVEPQAFTEISALGVEEQRVNVIGDLLDAPASLGAGYRVEAAIVTWSGEDVLTVPTSSLFRRGGRWQAFAVVDGRARLRALEIGQRARERAEVKAGLEEGELVVLFPSDLVEEGVRVRADPPAEVPPPGASHGAGRKVGPPDPL